MTLQQLNAAVDKVMADIELLVSQANVPIRTGRLRGAIKIRRVSDGYEVYVDTGSMTEEEWKKLEDAAMPGIAPYAAKVNENNPYWRRLALVIHDKLRRELGAEFKTTYNPRGES